MINISHEKCFGCQSCYDICPKQAIDMEIENGFRYPTVNENMCIKCGLCMKVCPAINSTENKNNNSFDVYAVWNNNLDTRVQCTSGGVCYELAKYIIGIGGYVAGVVWTEDYRNAKYIVTNSITDIEKIKQTKYFQPDMNGVYKRVKQLLMEGNTVLYIGSACTNDALKRFLGMEYENLYCVDYICRGYTSQLFHEKRIEYLEKKHKSKISFVQYKNKRLGWTRFGTLFKFQNGEEEYVNRFSDSYELMFKIQDNNTRLSCYECKYRVLPRHTDITVGDFWGIKEVDAEEMNKGISAVIISSPKGGNLFREVAEKFTYEKRTIEEVSRGNGALLNQLKNPNNAAKFFSDLEEKPFNYIEKKYGNKNILRNRKIKTFLKLLSKSNKISFVYYNFLCRKVKRKHHKFIFPCHGARIQISKGAKIVLNDHLIMNAPKHYKSKEECYLKLLEDGVFIVNGICRLAANNTVEINRNASLTVGRIDSNYGTTIICGNKIEIGNDVGFGRNVMIYDNNFHSTGLNKNVKLKPLIIEDHVWLCTGVTIVKGLRIERGAVCSINSTITRNVKSKNMVSGNPAKVMMTNIEW